MKFMLFFLTLLSTVGALACNIPQKDLLVRLALMKVDKANSDSNLLTLHRLEENSNISRAEFRRMIDQVKRVYGPIFKREDLNFRLEANWDDKQVNAFAGVRGQDRYVLIYGGYARHPLMTEDAFLSVICHEIGHHLGGYPKKTTGSWSSSEGQADYFSTLKCMKLVLKDDPNNKLMMEKLSLPSDVVKLCRAQFPDVDGYQICLRGAQAAEDHGRVLADLSKNNPFSVSLKTPDTKRAESMNLKHPGTQCRVDTKLAGALCNVSPYVALDDEDETIGTCHFNNFHILGNRPDGWFVHKK
jgi:hypothetical protein